MKMPLSKTDLYMPVTGLFLTGFIALGVSAVAQKNGGPSHAAVQEKRAGHVIQDLAAMPNDDSSSRQWSLSEEKGINARGAWALVDEQTIAENSRPVVAVLDLGVFTQHEDFQDADDPQGNNFWNNPNELDNGIDDDGNGYIDDLHGINGYFGKKPAENASQATKDAYNNRLKSYVGIEPASNASDIEKNAYQARLAAHNAGLVENGNPDPYRDRSSLTAGGDHGSNVAATIGAQGNNNIGGIGVNDHARMLACNVGAGNGSSGVSGSALNNCFDYVLEQKRNGVNIIAVNLSLGIPTTAGSSSARSWENTVKKFLDENIIVVAAAGNARIGFSGTDNDTADDYYPFFPASLEGLPNLISVTGFNEDGTHAGDMANYGRATVDIAAPIAAFGARVRYLSDGSLDFQYYQKKSGTSKAAPLVTGAVSLLYEYMLAQGVFTADSYDYDDMVTLRKIVLACSQPESTLENITTTGRRLRLADTDGTGLLTCADQQISQRLRPSQALASSLNIGDTLPIYYQYIACSGLECETGPASIRVRLKNSDGEMIEQLALVDDGTGADKFANDGHYATEITVTSEMAYLEFSDRDCITIRNYDQANCQFDAQGSDEPNEDDSGSDDQNDDSGSDDQNDDSGSDDQNDDSGSDDQNDDSGSDDQNDDSGSDDQNDDSGSDDQNDDSGSDDQNEETPVNDDSDLNDNGNNDQKVTDNEESSGAGAVSGWWLGLLGIGIFYRRRLNTK